MNYLILSNFSQSDKFDISHQLLKKHAVSLQEFCELAKGTKWTYIVQDPDNYETQYPRYTFHNY